MSDYLKRAAQRLHLHLERYEWFQKVVVDDRELVAHITCRHRDVLGLLPEAWEGYDVRAREVG